MQDAKTKLYSQNYFREGLFHDRQRNPIAIVRKNTAKELLTVKKVIKPSSELQVEKRIKSH